MNKKTALTILVIIIVVAILVIGFFLFFQKQNEENNPVIEAARNFFGGFFPSETTNNQTNTGQNTDNQNQNINSVIPKLRQISSFPVAGGVMFERTSTTSSLLIQENGEEQNQKITEVVYRFVERATGHIYETTSRDLSQKRITNTTIPKVYKAFFNNEAETVAMIYLNNDSLETFVGKINYPQISTTTQENNLSDNFANVTGSFLPTESFGFIKSQKSDDYFFLNTSDSETGEYSVNIYSGNFKNPLQNKNIFNLKTSEWNIQPLENGVLSLTTKSSFDSEGFLYFLDPKDGILKKKIGNTPGLISLVSPNGKRILYSYYDSGDTKMVLYDSDKKTYTTLNISTFPNEKCVWSQKDNKNVYCALPNNLTRGDFPNNWYQGKYSFNDGFIKINTDDFTVTDLMFANSETDINLDAINLQLSPSEDYLMFTNKTDLILWSLDIL